MKERTQKSIGIMVTILVFLTFVTVKASTSYSVAVDKIDVSAFPAVSLSLEISGNIENLAANNISILENGEGQRGPLVWLPPKAPNNKIDLFLLLDRSGNAEKYHDVILSKLEALMDYFEEEEVDAKIYLTSFGNSDTGILDSPDTFIDYSAMRSSFSGLSFDSGTSSKAHGLKRIYDLAERTPRSGADKVLLVINGSPFYDQERDSEVTTYTVAETVNYLAEKGFLTFVVGHPFRSLHAYESENTEEVSLSHALPGGYLGSFSSDLTILHDLLKNRDADHVTLYYTSSLMPAETSGVNVSLYISGSSAGSFSYLAISTAAPAISHLTATSVMSGDTLPVQVEVDPAGKMINEVELSYQDASKSFQKALLKKAAAKSTKEAQVFEGEIPADAYSEDGVNYYATVYTPYDEVGTGDDMVSVDVELIDEGITLESQLQVENGIRKVKWSWHGETVDMGTKYEIWAGDNKLEDYDSDSKNRYYTVPITDCNRYQIVKVKVKLKETADHPRAGGWSLFSRPGEYYDAKSGIPQDSFIESFGIEKMVECLGETAYETSHSFIASQSNYKSSSKLYLNRTLYYLTAILGQSDLKDLLPERYSLLYLFMDYLSQDDYDNYGMDEDLIPLRMLYKVITQANQTGNLKMLYEDSMDELSIRLRGNTSI